MTDQERKEDIIRLLEEAGLHEHTKQIQEKEGIPPYVYDTAKDCIENIKRINRIFDNPALSPQEKITQMRREAEKATRKFQTFLAVLQQGGFDN